MVGTEAALHRSVIEICLLAFGAVLLFGSIGAFFLYIPFLPIAVVVVVALGMVLTFLIGVWVGSTGVLQLRLSKLRVRRSRIQRGMTLNTIENTCRSIEFEE
jgi:hypothetical protein